MLSFYSTNRTNRVGEIKKTISPYNNPILGEAFYRYGHNYWVLTPSLGYARILRIRGYASAALAAEGSFYTSPRKVHLKNALARFYKNGLEESETSNYLINKQLTHFLKSYNFFKNQQQINQTKGTLLYPISKKTPILYGPHTIDSYNIISPPDAQDNVSYNKGAASAKPIIKLFNIASLYNESYQEGNSRVLKTNGVKKLDLFKKGRPTILPIFSHKPLNKATRAINKMRSFNKATNSTSQVETALGHYWLLKGYKNSNLFLKTNASKAFLGYWLLGVGAILASLTQCDKPAVVVGTTTAGPVGSALFSTPPRFIEQQRAFLNNLNTLCISINKIVPKPYRHIISTHLLFSEVKGYRSSSERTRGFADAALAASGPDNIGIDPTINPITGGYAQYYNHRLYGAKSDAGPQSRTERERYFKTELSKKRPRFNSDILLHAPYNNATFDSRLRSNLFKSGAITAGANTTLSLPANKKVNPVHSQAMLSHTLNFLNFQFNPDFIRGVNPWSHYKHSETNLVVGRTRAWNLLLLAQQQQSLMINNRKLLNIKMLKLHTDLGKLKYNQFVNNLINVLTVKRLMHSTRSPIISLHNAGLKHFNVHNGSRMATQKPLFYTPNTHNKYSYNKEDPNLESSIPIPIIMALPSNRNAKIDSPTLPHNFDGLSHTMLSSLKERNKIVVIAYKTGTYEVRNKIINVRRPIYYNGGISNVYRLSDVSRDLLYGYQQKRLSNDIGVPLNYRGFTRVATSLVREHERTHNDIVLGLANLFTVKIKHIDDGEKTRSNILKSSLTNMTINYPMLFRDIVADNLLLNPQQKKISVGAKFALVPYLKTLNKNLNRSIKFGFSSLALKPYRLHATTNTLLLEQQQQSLIMGVLPNTRLYKSNKRIKAESSYYFNFISTKINHFTQFINTNNKIRREKNNKANAPHIRAEAHDNVSYNKNTTYYKRYYLEQQAPLLLCQQQQVKKNSPLSERIKENATNSMLLKHKKMVKNGKDLDLQKKRKAKKQRLETRRQKKRIRLYPRPTWIRFRMFSDFLNKRNGLYKTCYKNRLIRHGYIENTKISNLENKHSFVNHIKDTKMKANYINFKPQKSENQSDTNFFRDFWVWSYNNTISNPFNKALLSSYSLKMQKARKCAFTQYVPAPNAAAYNKGYRSSSERTRGSAVVVPTTTGNNHPIIDYMLKDYIVALAKPFLPVVVGTTTAGPVVPINKDTLSWDLPYNAGAASAKPPHLRAEREPKQVASSIETKKYFPTKLSNLTNWSLNKIKNKYSISSKNKRETLWGLQKIRNQSKNNKTILISKKLISSWQQFVTHKNLTIFYIKLYTKMRSSIQKAYYLNSFWSRKPPHVRAEREPVVQYNVSYNKGTTYKLISSSGAGPNQKGERKITTIISLPVHRHSRPGSKYNNGGLYAKSKVRAGALYRQNLLTSRTERLNNVVREPWFNAPNNVYYSGKIKDFGGSAVVVPTTTGKKFDIMQFMSRFNGLPDHNIMLRVAGLLFHFCAIISLISISQIRCFLKFHFILIYKISNLYNFVVAKIGQFTQAPFFLYKNPIKYTTFNNHKDNSAILLRSTLFNVKRLPSYSGNTRLRPYYNLDAPPLQTLSSIVDDMGCNLPYNKGAASQSQYPYTNINNLIRGPRSMGLYNGDAALAASGGPYYMGSRYNNKINLKQVHLLKWRGAPNASKDALAKPFIGGQNNKNRSFFIKQQLYKLIITTKNYIFKTTYNLMDNVQLITRGVSAFFEKPAEITTTWIAFGFLVEWSSDFVAIIPETMDIYVWNTFSKTARLFTISYLLKPMTVLSHLKNKSFLLPNSISPSKLYNIDFIVLHLLQRRISFIFDFLIKTISQPDTDLIRRQQKGLLFWDVWGDYLLTAADQYNINIPALSTIKAEQTKLIDSISTLSAPDNYNAKIQNPQIKTKATNLLKTRRPDSKRNYLDTLGSAVVVPTTTGGILSKEPNRNFMQPHMRSGVALAGNISFLWQMEQNEITQHRWVVNQFITYNNSQNNDLFIDYHPPKSFENYKGQFINSNITLQQPVGTLVCQIYSGLFKKQISKNILLINSKNQSNLLKINSGGVLPSLLIQALAGETELKIVSDNAKRYAVVNRGFAIGIKLLRDVFDKIKLTTPCIFLLEDIDAIGERRPMLISDYGNDAFINSELFQSQLDEVHEKNQVLYQSFFHAITHYKKPFKSDLNTTKYLTDFYRFLRSQGSNNFSLTVNNNMTIKPKLSNEFKKISAEFPWGGLTGELLATKPRVSYSIRAKVSLLAEQSLANISAKLDMITDLLVIIDSVRGSKGFVVFATTDVPQVLDPALRRPGRLDETICMPNFHLNTHNKEKSYMYNSFKGYRSSSERTRGSADAALAASGSYNTAIHTRNYYNLENKSRINKIFGTLKKNNLFPNLNFTKLINISGSHNITLNFLFSNGNNLKHNYAVLLHNKTFITDKFSRGYASAALAAEGSAVVVPTTTGSCSLLFDYDKANRNTLLSAKPLHIREERKPVVVGTTTAEPNVAKYNKSNNPLYNLKLRQSMSYSAYTATRHLILNLKNNNCFYGQHSLDNSQSLFPTKQQRDINYLTLFGNYSQLTNQLMLTFSTNYNITSKKQHSFIKGPQNKGIHDYKVINGGGDAQDNVSYNKGAASGLRPLYKDHNNVRQCGSAALESLDFKVATTMMLAFIQKRYLYHKNLIVPKLLNFYDGQVLDEPPSPPFSNVLIPAKRFENYQRVFRDSIFNYKNNRKLINYAEKMQYYHDLTAYSLSNRNIEHLKTTTASSSPNSSEALSPSTIKIQSLLKGGSVQTGGAPEWSNINWYFDNRILKRHSQYLINQWWNGQLSEHNAESVFLSDIDWRSSFMKVRNNNSSRNFKKNLNQNITDVFLDFPDAEQLYNPRRRRWFLAAGAWEFWFNFDKNSSQQLLNHLILESRIKTNKYFYKNGELLDYVTTKVIKEGSAVVVPTTTGTLIAPDAAKAASAKPLHRSKYNNERGDGPGTETNNPDIAKQAILQSYTKHPESIFTIIQATYKGAQAIGL